MDVNADDCPYSRINWFERMIQVQQCFKVLGYLNLIILSPKSDITRGGNGGTFSPRILPEKG